MTQTGIITSSLIGSSKECTSAATSTKLPTTFKIGARDISLSLTKRGERDKKYQPSEDQFISWTKGRYHGLKKILAKNIQIASSIIKTPRNLLFMWLENLLEYQM
jgi:hypothetical protein